MARTNSIYGDFHNKVADGLQCMNIIIENEGIESYTHIYYKAIEIAINLYSMEMYATEEQKKVDYFELQIYKNIRYIAEKIRKNYNDCRHDKMIENVKLLTSISWYFSKLSNLSSNDTPRKLYQEMMKKIEKIEEKEAV